MQPPAPASVSPSVLGHAAQATGQAGYIEVDGGHGSVVARFMHHHSSSAGGGASPEMGTCMWTPGVLCGSWDRGHPLRALTLSFSPWPSSPASLTIPFSALT